MQLLRAYCEYEDFEGELPLRSHAARLLSSPIKGWRHWRTGPGGRGDALASRLRPYSSRFCASPGRDWKPAVDALPERVPTSAKMRSCATRSSARVHRPPAPSPVRRRTIRCPPKRQRSGSPLSRAPRISTGVEGRRGLIGLRFLLQAFDDRVIQVSNENLADTDLLLS